MKTKVILLLIVTGIITLSFTFASVKITATKESGQKTETVHNEPAGGFTSADKL